MKMICKDKNCEHGKSEHFVDSKNRFLRGKYKGEKNGNGERYEPFACDRVGCRCEGFR